MWVCSKWNENPKDEEKWEVLPHDSAMYWRVKNRFDDNGLGVWLQKSDYRPCDPPQPPERWVEVTKDCEYNHEPSVYPMWHNGKEAGRPYYRLRKVQLEEDRGNTIKVRWAFVVEKKESA